MTDYEVLRNLHHLGSEISGTVVARDALESLPGHPSILSLETSTDFPGLLPCHYLVDDPATFSPSLVPEIGTSVDCVIRNFFNETLHLSARPKDLAQSTIRKWREYYNYIDSLVVGSTVTGRVDRSVPFGLFIDIGGPFLGLIDIGHTRIDGGARLSREYAEWPKEGDSICCRISYFRLLDRQIGLGWLPGPSA